MFPFRLSVSSPLSNRYSYSYTYAVAAYRVLMPPASLATTHVCEYAIRVRDYTSYTTLVPMQHKCATTHVCEHTSMRVRDYTRHTSMNKPPCRTSSAIGSCLASWPTVSRKTSLSRGSWSGAMEPQMARVGRNESNGHRSAAQETPLVGTRALLHLVGARACLHLHVPSISPRRCLPICGPFVSSSPNASKERLLHFVADLAALTGWQVEWSR